MEVEPGRELRRRWPLDTIWGRVAVVVEFPSGAALVALLLLGQIRLAQIVALGPLVGSGVLLIVAYFATLRRIREVESSPVR